MLEQNLKRSSTVQQLLNELEGIRGQINQLKKLKDYHEKLNKAISYVEQLLQKNRISTGEIHQRVMKRSTAYTAVEIDQYLNDLRSKLQSSTIYPRMLVVSLEGLYARKNFIRQKEERFKPFDTYKIRAQEAFQLLKQELLEELLNRQRDFKILHQNSLRTLEEESVELTLCKTSNSTSDHQSKLSQTQKKYFSKRNKST